MESPYSESQKRAAVRACITEGSLAKGGAHVGIPWETIAGWKHRFPEWWTKLYAEISLELLSGLTEASQHKALKLRERLLDLLAERVENGESKLNVKTGQVVLVPVGMSDLTKAFAVLGGRAESGPKVAEVSEEARMLELTKVAEEDRASRTN